MKSKRVDAPLVPLAIALAAMLSIGRPLSGINGCFGW